MCLQRQKVSLWPVTWAVTRKKDHACYNDPLGAVDPTGNWASFDYVRLRLKRDGTRAKTRFRLSAKRTSPLNRRGRQFSRLLAAEVCASAVVMPGTPCSGVV